MLRCCAFSLVLLVTPTLCRAQDAPENLLSDKTQIYFRWDGTDAHRDAYVKTATGKLMQGELGKLFDGIYDQLKIVAKDAITQEGLLRGEPAEKLEKRLLDLSQALRLPPILNKHGFVLAFEARGVLPPAGQVTLIIPNADKEGDALFALFRLIAGEANFEIVTSKIGTRTVFTIKGEEFLKVGWWMEGKHAVLVAATETMDEVVKRMQNNKGSSIAKNDLFKRVSEFKRYETSFRGYIDVAKIRTMAVAAFPVAKPIVEKLGLDGLRAITYVSGFEDKADRSTLEVHVAKERKGVLSMLSGKSFTLEDVPPLPNDLASWSMTSFDLAAGYDGILSVVETIVQAVQPEELPAIKEGVKQINQAIGIDLRKDLLAHFDDQIITYASPAEGFLSLNQTFMIKVKDGDKIKQALDRVTKNLSLTTGVEVRTDKSQYQGVELCQVHVRQQGFFIVPSYAVYKGWFILSTYPQPVQGAILRLNGKLPAWKPDKDLADSLSKLPKKFTSISVVDPRPGVKFMLGILPIAGGAVRSIYPEMKFNVASIPNALAVNEELFPNVTVTSETDSVVRIESRSSLPIPFDLSSIGSAYAFAALAGFAFAF